MNTLPRKTLPNRLTGVAGIAALMFAASALADTTSLRYAGLDSTIATEILIPVQAAPIAVHLGTYALERQSPAGSFMAYCNDPFQYSSGAFQTYGVSTLAAELAGTRLADVTRLFGNAYAASLTGATRAAGFQLALWELWHDDKNLNTGLVQTTANTDAGVRAEAQSLLDRLGGWSAGTPYHVTVYTNAGYQDYVTALPVPEPAAWATMLAGLGLAGGFVARRRQGT